MKNAPENLHKSGAERLKKTIEKYWRDQGRVVKCRVVAEQVGYMPIYVVRSDIDLYCPPFAPKKPEPRVKYKVVGL